MGQETFALVVVTVLMFVSTFVALYFGGLYLLLGWMVFLTIVLILAAVGGSRR